MKEGYTLVVCEKPDTARAIADALSGGRAKPFIVDGARAFRLRYGDRELVVCSAQGHLYEVSDPCGERVVYPVFDLEWYPSEEGRRRGNASKWISALKKLAPSASGFVNACDFDVEGEVIGFNALKYACGEKETDSERVVYSTLARDDLVGAFEGTLDHGRTAVARAGRARHVVDFLWGVNLSRILTLAANSHRRRYLTVSVGRVQGPTLAFLAQREIAIRSFVPLPFWTVSAELADGPERLKAAFSGGRIWVRSEARTIGSRCQGKRATVSHVEKSTVSEAPPFPFDTGALQREAFKLRGLAPWQTMRAAERLYLKALISYPRTDSQRLPRSIDCARILKSLGTMKDYSRLSADALRRRAEPRQGPKSDLAHPAIHPTGEKPGRPLERTEAAVFDLVVRRFLAAFGEPSTRETVRVSISVAEYGFTYSGATTVSEGWRACYGKSRRTEHQGHHFEESRELDLLSVDVSEGRTEPPARFDQSSLLEKMEQERIGTKATRADVISTLVSRGYVEGMRIAVTDLGLSVYDVLQERSAKLVSVQLTRSIEEHLESEDEEMTKAVLRDCAREVVNDLTTLRRGYDEVGKNLSASGSPLTLTGMHHLRDEARRQVRAAYTSWAEAYGKLEWKDYLDMVKHDRQAGKWAVEAAGMARESS